MPKYENAVKQPKNLSPRVKWLRDYFFEGTEREWNNEYNAFTNGKEWDRLYDELSFYIVPETKQFFQPFTTSYVAAGKIVPVKEDFFKLSDRKSVV